MTDFGRVIIAHTLAHMREAFKVAHELEVPLVLQTATGALRFAGAQYLLTMYEKAHMNYPDVVATLILNCDDAAAETISAMRIGHAYVRSTAAGPTREKLKDIALQLGVVWVEGEFQALDLRYTYQVYVNCKLWLLPLE